MSYDHTLLFKRIAQTLEGDPCRPLSKLSQKLRVSRRTIQNIVSIVTGKKFKDLRQDLLVQRIKNLLVSPNSTIRRVYKHLSAELQVRRQGARHRNRQRCFGARYYSNRFGRWLSADWSSVPVPVPYANLSNPQTLNLYAMVADDPETFADLDGHEDDDGIFGHIVNFVLSAGETYLSDNFFGVFRPNPKSPEGQFGQAVGDFATQQSVISVK